MSSVDKRIVEMQFDNKQFENGIQTSLRSLEELRKGLKLDSVDNGFKKIGDSLETISSKFTFFGRVSMQVMDRLATKVVNVGENLVRHLSVGQISRGWTKYEEKTASVQTIINATGKDINTVNGYLNKLMWFSDETSYNFTEMTAALGTLTSSGGDVEKMIPMIEGMAAATAFAGKSANEFSRVIFNLNQSYSQGYLSLMDWRSVELAQVGSEQLKQTIIDTAVALGTLKKDSQGVIKTAKGTVVTAANMSSTLNEKWANQAVMEEAFGKFGAIFEEAYKLVDSGVYDTAAEAIDALSGNYDDVYVSAAKAAQEAKTFKESIDATTDAVSSGWMKTFEIIFGNYEEAKVFWTDFTAFLWDVFASGAEARNELLQEWKDLGGRDDLLAGMKDIFATILDLITAVKTAFGDIFPSITADRLKKVSEGFRNFASTLREVLSIEEKFIRNDTVEVEVYADTEPFETELKNGMKSDAVKELQKNLAELGYDVGPTGADGIFGPKTLAGLKKFQEEMGITADGIYNAETHAKMMEKLGKSNTIVGRTTETVARYATIYSDQLSRLRNILSGVFAIAHIGFQGLEFGFNVVKNFIGLFSPVGDALLTIASGLADCFISFDKWLQESGVFSKWLEKVKDFLAPVGKGLKKFSENLLTFFGFGDAISDSGKKIKTFKELWAKLSSSVKNSKGWARLTEAIEKLKDAFSSLGPVIKKSWGKLKESLGTKMTGLIRKAGENLPRIIEKIASFFAKALEFIEPVVRKIPEIYQTVKTFLVDKFSSMSGKMGNVFGKLKTTLVDFFSRLWEGIVGFFGGSGKDGAIETAKKTVQERLGSLDSFAEWCKELWGKASANLSAFFDAVKNFWDKYKWWIIVGGSILGIVIVVVKAITGIRKILSDAASIARLKLGEKEDSFADKFTDFAKAIAIIAASIIALGLIPISKLTKGAIAVGLILASIVVVAVLSKRIAKDEKNIEGLNAMAKLFTSLAIAIGVISAAIWFLGSLGKNKLTQGSLVVLGIMTAIVVLSYAMSKTAKSLEVQISMKGFIRLAIAIALLAGTIYLLGQLSPKNLLKSLGVVVALTTIVGAIAVLVAKVSSSESGNFKMGGFMGLALSIALLAGTVYLLGKKDVKSLRKGIAVVAALGGILAGIAFITKFVSAKTLTSAAIMMGAFVLVIYTFGKACEMVNGIKPGVLVKFAKSFAIAMLSFVAAISVAGMLGPATMALGAAGIGAAIAIISTIVLGILTLIGSIEAATDGGFSKTILNAGKVLYSVGNAIGLLVKGIKDGFLGKEMDFSEFAKDISGFGDSLKALSGASADVSEKDIDAAIGMGNKLKNFAENLPRMGGIKGAIFGNADFEGFGNGVKAFGDGIRAFRDAIIGLAEEKDTGTLDDDITEALALGTKLNTYASGLKPISTGIQRSVNSIGDFGTSIGKVREKIGGISSQEGLEDDVDKAVEIAQKITGFFLEVRDAFNPPEGAKESYAQILMQANGALETVIPNISEFGIKISEYGEAINGIATTTISEDTTEALTNAQSLANFFAGLSGLEIEKDHGFLTGLFADDTKAESFLTYTENFGEAIANLNTSIHDLANSTITKDSTAALDVAQEIANFLDSLSQKNIEQKVGALEAFFTGGENKTQSFFDYMEDLGTTVNTIASTDGISGIAANGIIEDTDALVHLITGISEAFDLLSGSGFSQAEVDTMNSNLSEFLLYSLEPIGTFAEKVSEELNDSDLDPFTFSSIAGGFHNIIDSVSQMYALLSGDAAGGFNTESFLDGLDAQAVIKKLDEFATQVAPAATAAKNTIEGSSEEFSNAGGNLGTTLVSGITDAGDGSGMTGLCNGMIAQIRSFEGKFKSTGLYLGTGLVRGLKNSQALAVAAAGAMARAMLTKIRAVFNEHSPSKETELDGFYLVKGLANGVTKNTRIATGSVEGMGDSVLKSMGRTITTLSDAMSMDFNEDPVIRPVVDFSNVTTGARTINSMLSGRRSLSVDASYDGAVRNARIMTESRKVQNGKQFDQSVDNSSNSAVNVTGNTFYIRDDQDVRNLASELASMSNRYQRALGKGY